MISMYLLIMSMLLLTINNFLYPLHAFILSLLFWWHLVGFQHCPLISFSSFGWLKCFFAGTKSTIKRQYAFAFCFVPSPLSLLFSLSAYSWTYDSPHDWWKSYKTSWHSDCGVFFLCFWSNPHITQFITSCISVAYWAQAHVLMLCISSLSD